MDNAGEIELDPQRVIVTARTAEEESNAILVSFRARWYDALREGKIRAVIRKSVPRNRSTRWMYMYVTGRVGALIGRSEILSLSQVERSVAIARAAALCLTDREILDYMGPNQRVGLYELEHIQRAVRILSKADLRTELFFQAPQAFIRLSWRAKGIIDRRAGFGEEET